MYIRKYACLFTTMLWFCSLIFLYVESRASVEIQLTESIVKNEMAIGQLFDVAVAYNLTLKNQMAANIEFFNNEKASHPLFTSLKSFPEIDAYGLGGHETVYGKPYEANLTGIGLLEDVDSSTLQEINAALSLNVSTPMKEKNYDFVWSYYTSKKGFMLLAPRVDINTFNFKKSIYDKPFWQVATPESNPERETVISDLYEDAAGQGWMISLSTPVYIDSTFKGVVSLDLGIKELEKALYSHTSKLDENLLLVSKEGVIAVGEQLQGEMIDSAQFKEHQAKPYQLILSQDKVMLLSKPIRGKFYVVYKMPRFKFALSVIKNAFNKAIIYTLAFIIFYLIIRLATMLAQTRKMAQIDGLSQLYNRQTLEELSVREFLNTKRRHGQISVIMLDIDCFKQLNDMHGHEAGDNGIRHIAKLISKIIRETDILGRYGGEEFLITLPDTGIEGATHVAEKLRSAVERSPFENGLKLTVSIGCSEYKAVHHNDEVNFQDLCSNADTALYQAKRKGRNRVEQYIPEEKYSPEEKYNPEESET